MIKLRVGSSFRGEISVYKTIRLTKPSGKAREDAENERRKEEEE